MMLALAVAASTQAMAFGSHGRITKKAEVNAGCPAAFYRGSGGNCVYNPDYPKPYRPDPYWTPCDYSLGPQYPEGCGNYQRHAMRASARPHLTTARLGAPTEADERLVLTLGTARRMRGFAAAMIGPTRGGYTRE